MFTFSTFSVHAGNINTEEAAIISAAQGSFQSNGINYKVDPQFIDQLISYLNQDDVDLDAAKKEEVIGLMFSNVERGVAEGYLIPVIEQEGSQDSGINLEESASDIEGNETQEYDNAVLDEIRKQPTAKTEVDQNKNKITVTKEDNSNVLVVNTVIKNTGYNISPAIGVIFGLLGVFIICIFITIKYNFFKQEGNNLEK